MDEYDENSACYVGFEFLAGGYEEFDLLGYNAPQSVHLLTACFMLVPCLTFFHPEDKDDHFFRSVS
jgi:hypothetical protein